MPMLPRNGAHPPLVNQVTCTLRVPNPLASKWTRVKAGHGGGGGGGGAGAGEWVVEGEGDGDGEGAGLGDGEGISDGEAAGGWVTWAAGEATLPHPADTPRHKATIRTATTHRSVRTTQ